MTGFAALDALTGGLQESRSYLLYGDVGTGKTTCAIQFLYQGLLAGETVALVTRRSAQAVFEHGAAFGMPDLKRFADEGDLLVFEYKPRVFENATRLKEDGHIYREFAALLEGEAPHRLVFDPVTPLLATPSPSAATFRARSLVQSFAELKSTALYLFDTPEGQESLASFKDFVAGVMRFEAAAPGAGAGKLALERFPGVRGRSAQLDIECVPGVGLTESTQSPSGAANRKVLVVAAEPGERAMFRDLLGQNASVSEAETGADALAKVAAAPPDLVVIDHDAPGVTGVEFARRLRQNGVNVPIVIVANPIRRAHDRIQIMASGADECLERPVDGRILKLKVQNLLRRYDSAAFRQGAGLDPSVVVGLERDKTTSTTNLSYFYDRVSTEAQYATENGLTFAVVVLSIPEEAQPDPGLAALAGSLIREYDLFFYGPRIVAVLLAETDEAGARVFLRRFAESWKGDATPSVHVRTFDRHSEPGAAIGLVEAVAGAALKTLSASAGTLGIPGGVVPAAVAPPRV
ncbi:MAG TPA: ATPase domain-containing protein [Vicinamibacteria bacterium]|nr:ATPase domain-containing protein [Vicinamibacteria bacterium]